MISIQLRHHFLFSPVFPFFPLSLHEVWRRRFFHRKKRQLRGCRVRKRAEQEWVSETDCPAHADTQVGLFVSDDSMLFVSATRLRVFERILQHLLDSLFGKKRTSQFLFLVFSVVLLIVEQTFFFSPNDVFISCKSIDAVAVFDVKEAFFSASVPHVQPSAYRGRFSLCREARSWRVHPAANTQTDACSRAMQPLFGGEKKKT